MIKVRVNKSAYKKLDLAVQRVEAMFVQEYRNLIWNTLQELVLTTPQWSGHAAANWNIGFDSPDTKIHSHEFEQEEAAMFPLFIPRERGDIDPWLSVSARYGGSSFSPEMMRIKRRTRVYFTNNVLGDDPSGGSRRIRYLAQYQDPSWHSRLRAVNLPYETAQEVIRRMDAQWRRAGAELGASGKGLGFGRLSGASFSVGAA